MRIQTKIFWFIFITSVVVFASVIALVIIKYRSNSINEATRLADIYAEHGVTLAKNKLEKDLTVCETLSQSFTDSKLPKEYSNNILKNILIGHPDYPAVSMSWELKFIQPGYTRDYGRESTLVKKEAGVINFDVDTLELNGDNYESDYYKSKISGNSVLSEPFYQTYSKTENVDSIFIIRIAVPVFVKEEFAGLTGVDIPLEKFQEITEQVKPYDESYSMLLSNNGVIISSSKHKNIGDTITNVLPGFEKYKILNKIKEGAEPYSFMHTDSTGMLSYLIFSPVIIRNSSNPWSFCLVIPSKKVKEEGKSFFMLTIFFGAAGILIFALITLVITQRMMLPLRQTTTILKDLDKGIIDPSKKIKVSSKGELADMSTSINNLIDTLNKTTDFAKKIGEGNFNVQYNALSEHDVLGNALIDMQENLQISQEQEEIRQLERKKLNWAQDGLTELGEVLRTSTDDFEEYLLSILSYITKYLKADQGAIFILNTLDAKHPYLELRSAYAYEKKKALEAKIEIGESLVGRCFQEKEVIYMTNVPEGYTFVSSGLGGHEPRCLFLMPLLFEDEPFGVIELASFRELADFEIEFLKTIGERVASSISVMEKNVQTKQLLEQYQVQSQELQSREQLLQENLQELQKLQEDATAKEKESSSIIEALSNIGTVIWYDLDGKIVEVKDKHLRDRGLTIKELKGKNLRNYSLYAKENPKEYRKLWENLNAGKSEKLEQKTETKKGIYWMSDIYTPIFDSSGKPFRIINIGLNITKQKELEEKIEQLQAEIKNIKKK